MKIFKQTLMIAALGFSTLAFAGNEACKMDAEQLCQGMKPGDGHFMHCLESHEAELSNTCKEHISEHKAAMKEFHKEGMKELHDACHADLEKVCEHVKAGEGRVMKCLREHKADLSAGCQASIAAHRSNIQAKRAEMGEQKEEAKKNEKK